MEVHTWLHMFLSKELTCASSDSCYYMCGGLSLRFGQTTSYLWHQGACHPFACGFESVLRPNLSCLLILSLLPFWKPCSCLKLRLHFSQTSLACHS